MASTSNGSDATTFTVRYSGCIEVKASMKALDFPTRILIAKEGISRVCEAAGFKTIEKRKVDRRIASSIAEHPNMEYAGSNVTLSISTSSISMAVVETGAVIVNHEMSDVSFASGGDSETLDFIAYTGKDEKHGRACFVIECGSGFAQDVLQAISHAFQVRFQQVQDAMKKLPPPSSDPDYYNDLPGKVPPDPPPSNKKDVAKKLEPLEKISSSQVDLIDLNHSPAPLKTPGKAAPEYVNTTPNGLDPFDMNLMVQVTPSDTKKADDMLYREPWYHGPISRHESEMLVTQDGDFLVRESPGIPGQYVLTGMQGGMLRHLLLVDSNGDVRTKDRSFDSVVHLISYHRDNLLPIISAENALVLKNPVFRK